MIQPTYVTNVDCGNGKTLDREIQPNGGTSRSGRNEVPGFSWISGPAQAQERLCFTRLFNDSMNPSTSSSVLYGARPARIQPPLSWIPSFLASVEA